MVIIAGIIYIFMAWISNWNLIWPITLIVRGAIGDKLIAIIWIILLIAGLN